MTYVATYSRRAKQGLSNPNIWPFAVETQALAPHSKMEELPSCLSLHPLFLPLQPSCAHLDPSSLKGRRPGW